LRIIIIIIIIIISKILNSGLLNYTVCDSNFIASHKRMNGDKLVRM